MKPHINNRLNLAALATALLISASPSTHGASGSWAGDANGNWSDTTKWTGGTVADGAGNTATFAPNITAVRTTTLDSDRTLGGLVFGKSSGYIATVQSWTINGSGFVTLDNSGATPTITCWMLRSAGNSAVNVQTRLFGNMGYKKLGTGTLVLQANNLGLSGDIIVAEGRLFNNNAFGIGDMNVVVSNGCYISFFAGGNYPYNNFSLNGIGKSQDAQVKSAIYADNNTVAITLGGTVTLNATSDIGTSGNTSSPYQTASVTLGGRITGPGGLVKNGTANTFGVLTLGAGSTADYTGPTLVSNGVFAVDTLLSASPVTNFSNTMLAGDGGYIPTAATVLGGAFVAPGRTNVVGTLSISNLVCASGAQFIFDLDPNTTTEGSYANDLLLVTNLTLNGRVTNSINFVNTSTPLVGRYILARYSGVATGLTNLILKPAFAILPIHPGLDTSVPGEIALVISNSATLDVTWAGDSVNNVWDLNTTSNWLDSGSFSAQKYEDGQTVRFTDSGSIAPPVKLAGALAPGQVFVNASINYELAGTGKLTGGGALTKSGSGTLTISATNNDYTGATTISGGVLRFGADNVLPGGSDKGVVVVNASTLDVNGHSATIKALQGSGTVDNTSAQPCTLTVYSPVPSGGAGHTITGTIANSGGGALTVVKTGPGMWQWPLTGSGTYTGGTIINDGRFMVRKAGVLGYGSITVSNGADIFFYSAVGSPVTNDFYLYDVGTVQEGQLYDTVASAGVTNEISGTINLVRTASLGCSGAPGELKVSGKITGPGALQKSTLANTNFGFGKLSISNPNNDFRGGVKLYTGTLRLDANEVIPDGAGKGDLSLTNGCAGIPGTWANTMIDLNGHVETINGLFGEGTVSNSSAMAATLILGNNDAQSAFVGSMAGNLAIQKVGAGAWLFNGTNNSSGTTTVTAGTLTGSGVFAGQVTIQPAAALAVGGYAVGVMAISNNLTLNGNLTIKIDKSQPQSNDLVVVTGSLSNGGTGVLTVTNLGPALTVGDKFTLFSKPMTGGAALNISAPAGVVFTNQLATDGSVQVLTAPLTPSPNPTNLAYQVSGNILSLTWPADHLGWYAQSNAVDVATSAFWYDIEGSQSVTNLNIPIGLSAPKVFYRLRYP
jgi:autotransporter-associated beta strand protein